MIMLRFLRFIPFGVVLTLLFAGLVPFAEAQPSPAELLARRQALMTAAKDGIVLLHSSSGLKRWEDSGFRQDADFYYFTGMRNLHRSIVAIDGNTRQSWLFTAVASERTKARSSDLSGMDAVYVEPGKGAEEKLRFDHVVPWDKFVSFIDTRLQENPSLVLYTDDSGQVGQMLGDSSNPEGLPP